MLIKFLTDFKFGFALLELKELLRYKAIDKTFLCFLIIGEIRNVLGKYPTIKNFFTCNYLGKNS
jgi:hypothetical protein